LLDKLDDLGLLGWRISHASSSPSPLMVFLSRRFSRVRPATTSFKAAASRRRSFTSPTSRRGRCRPPAGACRPPGTPSTSRNTSRRQCPAAQLRDVLLAAQSFQHNADLLFGRILLPRRPANVADKLLGRTCGGIGFLSHHLSSLAATMSQKSSVPQAAKFVSQALKRDTP